jgi:hypothetical protein
VSYAHGLDASARRLGRAVLFILQQDPVIQDNVVRADIDTILLAGRAMDFAARLQGHGRTAAPELALSYARLAGLSGRELGQRALPILKQADVIDYGLSPDGHLNRIEEYVGVTGTVIDQTFRVLDGLGPSDAELAVLHSVEIASLAPLTEQQHLEQIVRRGLNDSAAAQGLKLSRAIGVNKRIRSSELREHVIFNPHVWGTGQVDIAAFLRNLPSAERDSLLGIFEQASARPGIALDETTASSPIMTSARKVGLVQAATVKSSHNARTRTYVFSPLIQAADDMAPTTEALHQRKLFVAHILFGHDQAIVGYGRIREPTVLVRKLLNYGVVGPATNIGTDYHLLEAAGVVAVEVHDDGRAILRLIKREIVQGGLAWLEAGAGSLATTGPDWVKRHQVPAAFVTPERDRAGLPDNEASDEITRSVVFRLREEAQRDARAESAFPIRT